MERNRDEASMRYGAKYPRNPKASAIRDKHFQLSFSSLETSCQKFEIDKVHGDALSFGLICFQLKINGHLAIL
jgi:hypothetical protein